MARYGGTLTAATNAAVAAADTARLTVAIQNLHDTELIHVEFGLAATVTAADGCWVVQPGATLILSQGDYPEIKNSVNLISAGTPSYIVRTNP